MKRFFTTTLSLLFLVCAHSQENLVVNGSFEDISGKLKPGAKVDMATGWMTTSADIFAGESKDLNTSTPDNIYGREKALDGYNYAGIVAYSYQGKEARSYLMAEFSKPLEKGKKYCVRFSVSLSDISKFGVNNIAARIDSKEYKMEDGPNELLLEPHIKHSKNKVIETMVYWEPICGTYTATGGEKYILIGNFEADKATTALKMKKAVQFKQAQTNNAYYFVDDVSVTAYDPAEKCTCEKEAFVDVPKVVYKKQENNMSEDQMMEEVMNMKINFDSLSADLKGPALGQVQTLLNFLRAKSTLTVAIIGHTSNSEADAAKKTTTLNNLSNNRAKAVADFLIKNGINKTRIKVEGVKNLQPFNYDESAAAQAENRAVNVGIITE